MRVRQAGVVGGATGTPAGPPTMNAGVEMHIPRVGVLKKNAQKAVVKVLVEAQWSWQLSG